MGRPTLEVADIFREHGSAWREAQRGHLSLAQLKVMSAIEQCRSAALGGHVLRCNGCGADQVSYNSCRNRHCPKCQSSAAQRWLDARQADLLPVEYYHVVFTLPAPIADIAYQNKAAIYGLLFDVAAEVLLTIAADARHLGARIGATLVLHTWGSALTHHPHVHGIVPGGGLGPDGKAWVACRPGSSSVMHSPQPTLDGVLTLPTRVLRSARCEPNPHSVPALNTRGGVRRGFLPRGLCDTCPPVSAVRRSVARAGRYLTTLNRRRNRDSALEASAHELKADPHHRPE